MAKKGTILVVDDDPGMHKVVRRMLRDYDVVAADDGMEGFLVACAWPPDLIILDLVMPGLDGYAVSTMLRRDPRTSAIPIVVLSDLVDVEPAQRSLNSGADVFATKAFELPALGELVENIFAETRERSA